MPDEAQAVDAEERRAAELRRVDAAGESSEGGTRQHRPEARGGRRRQFLAQHRPDRADDAFADLQRDVAGEAVADDDVRLALEQVTGLDVADERQPAGLEGAERLAGELIALERLLADREQP